MVKRKDQTGKEKEESSHGAHGGHGEKVLVKRTNKTRKEIKRKNHQGTKALRKG